MQPLAYLGYADRLASKLNKCATVTVACGDGNWITARVLRGDGGTALRWIFRTGVRLWPALYPSGRQLVPEIVCASADESQPRRRVRRPIRCACVSLQPRRPQPRCWLCGRGVS